MKNTKKLINSKPNFKLWLLTVPLVLLVVGLAAAIFLLSSSQDLRQQAAGLAYIKCKTDSQCNGRMLCQNGICKTPITCKIGTGNQGCPAGTFCDIGKTGTPICIIDSGCSVKKPCPAGYACDYSVGRPEGEGGTCRTAFGSCSDTKPCPLNQTCTNGSCVKPFASETCKPGEVWDDLFRRCTKPLSICKNNSCPAGQECVRGGCLPEMVCSEPTQPGGPATCKRGEPPQPTRVPIPTTINKQFECLANDPNACGGHPERCTCVGGPACTGTICKSDLGASCQNQGRAYCKNYQGTGMSCCSVGYKCCDSGEGCCPR